MTAITKVPAERATNDRVELARYAITAGERVIYGQRVLGVVRSSTSRPSGTAAAT